MEGAVRTDVRIGGKVRTVLLIAFPAVVVVAASAFGATGVVTGRRLWPTARSGAGFNCCENCGAPLPPHAQHPWRYDDNCGRCDHRQSWASPTAGPAPTRPSGC
jgi:hypothetical protein